MMIIRSLLALLAAVALLSCGGGGGSSGSDSPTPTGPTNSGAPTASGDPSNADYIELGAQLASMAADQLIQALSASTGGVLPGFGPMDLRRPAQSSDRTAAYFCCGPQSGNRSYVTVSTSITVPAGSGALGILQAFGSFTETEWSSTVANNWRIDLSQLRVTSEIETSGTSVNASQQLRLSGTLRYAVPNASTKDVVVDVLFRYANLESSVPTATGQIGGATLAGQSTTPQSSPGRCSRPREGCGPLANGDAPCTVWPRCPGT